MKYLIETPNPRYSGVTEGVAFSSGRAVIDDEHLKNMLVNDYGYKATEIGEEKESEQKDASKKSAKKSDK